MFLLYKKQTNLFIHTNTYLNIRLLHPILQTAPDAFKIKKQLVQAYRKMYFKIIKFIIRDLLQGKEYQPRQHLVTQCQSN